MGCTHIFFYFLLSLRRFNISNTYISANSHTSISLEGVLHTRLLLNVMCSDCVGCNGVYSKWVEWRELIWIAWCERTLLDSTFSSKHMFDTVKLMDNYAKPRRSFLLLNECLFTKLSDIKANISIFGLPKSDKYLTNNFLFVLLEKYKRSI